MSANTLDEGQIEPLHAHPTRDERIHQYAVNRGGGTVLVIVFGKVGFDALRQSPEMLTHCFNNLPLHVLVLTGRSNHNEDRFPHVEDNIHSNYVLLTPLANDLLERAVNLVQEKHVLDSETCSMNAAPNDLENSTVRIVEHDSRIAT